MTLRIGLHCSTGWVSKLIQFQTRSIYSHASLILDDDSILEAMQGRGVVHDRQLTDCRESVHLFKPVFLPRIHGAALTFARSQVGKPYDYTMVARFVSRQQEKRETQGKWFCSELVYAAFASGGGELFRDTEPWEVSPGLLAKSPYLIPVGVKAAV